MSQPEASAGNSAAPHVAGKATRRSFLDFILGLTVVAWLGSIIYPVVRYLKPLPQAGPTGPRELTADELTKLNQKQFVILLVGGKRVIVLQDPQREILAFSAKCTHEGCTVQYLPNESIIWCPCHNGKFGINGHVLSGPPPRPLPQYAVQRQEDGGIMISPESQANA